MWLYRKPAVHICDYDAEITLAPSAASPCGYDARLQLRCLLRMPKQWMGTQADEGEGAGGGGGCAPLGTSLRVRATLRDATGRVVLRTATPPWDGTPPPLVAPHSAPRSESVPAEDDDNDSPAPAAAGPAAAGPPPQLGDASPVWSDQELSMGGLGDVVALEAAAAIPHEDLHLWSAETPYLYSLVVALVDESAVALGDEAGGAGEVKERTEERTEERGVLLEAESRKMGARTACIHGKQLLLNGVAVTLKGVNRHEHDAQRGKAVDEASMMRDAILIKAFNFNAVRSSHYPNATRWYEICDEVGLFVIDEANIETHGLVGLPQFLSRLHLNASPVWRKALLARFTRMVESNKNHPCIFMWSLGNESGVGPTHLLMRQWIAKRDPSRPAHYEGLGNCHSGASDLLSPMYAHPAHCVALVDAEENPNRPLILCEYSHAMGNSNGGLHEYWKLFREHPHVQVGTQARARARAHDTCRCTCTCPC